MIKPFQDYNDQLTKLQNRGCQIDDSKFACSVLAHINYYRFSAYFLPFKTASGTYKVGTNFTTIYHTYEFDRKLRIILFAAIARIEILLRAQIAYYHAEHYGPLGYLDSTNFRSKGHNHARFMQHISEEISKNQNIPFVKHHIDNYGGQFPLWVMSELFTLGMLSRFYADLLTHDQKMLAKKLCTQSNAILKTWLRCCTDLRNICAHHGRIYYRLFSAAPAGISTSDPLDERRLFAMLLVLKQLYPDKADWNSEVCAALDSLIREYQADINLQYIGFPQNWLEVVKYK
jgi:abortive infection bacteriophage resistance protein